MGLLGSNTVHWGGFDWTGNFTTVDLTAASTNALNGALLARRPDHLYHGWEEPLPKGPKGVVLHPDKRPLLGRKLQGKSKRELRDLGLLVEDASTSPGGG
jgi:hypothetical protein